MNTIAVIPARGGSKGIPKKNLQKVCGKSLIAHALNCAANSKYEMDVVISTDSPEILEHARSIGYKGEYLRPNNLAQDDSRTEDAVLDVILWASENYRRDYDVIVLLQPTSPLRLSSDLDASLDAFFAADNATSLISVNTMHEHPVECITVNSNGWNYLVEPDAISNGRQSYNQKYFYINGAIYICNCRFLVHSNSFIDYANSILYEMPKFRSIDIDTEEDLHLANYLGKKILLR